jgi:hypothetical protein
MWPDHVYSNRAQASKYDFRFLALRDKLHRRAISVANKA